MEKFKRIYSTFSTLKRLEEKYGPRGFGRVCQVLLGLTFKELNFIVSLFQQVGRPDIIAIRGHDKYAIEVKTAIADMITIKEKDLNGIKSSGHYPVLAVLLYPSAEPKWLMVDAKKMHEGRFYKVELEQYSIKFLGKEINITFPIVVKKYYEIAENSISALRQMVK